MKLPRLAFVILALISTSSATAAVIYSGLQNIAIPFGGIPVGFDGVYINLDNGATSTSAITGWDINPFFGGAGIANNSNFQPARTGTGNSDPVVRLNNGDLVSSLLSFSTGFGGSGDPVAHIGNGANQFGDGSEGYLGFRFTTDTSAGPYYGWIRLEFTNNTSGGMIKDWAYDNTGSSLTIGSVPEPSRAIFLFFGISSLVLRRRRSVA